MTKEQKLFEKQLNFILESIFQKPSSTVKDFLNVNSMLAEIFDLDKSFISKDKKKKVIKDNIKKAIDSLTEIDAKTFNRFKEDLKIIFLKTDKLTKSFIKGKSNSDNEFYKKRISDVSNVYKNAIEAAKKNVNDFKNLKEKSLTKDLDKNEKILYDKLEKQIKEKKLVSIDCKDGKTRNYNLKKYMELVRRTNFGNMQTDTAISTSTANNIVTFTITAHNTKTEICKVHENKTYTTDPNLKVFPFLTAERRPLYHINCQHRLVPKPFTQKQLQRLTRNRVD